MFGKEIYNQIYMQYLSLRLKLCSHLTQIKRIFNPQELANLIKMLNMVTFASFIKGLLFDFGLIKNNLKESKISNKEI